MTNYWVRLNVSSWRQEHFVGDFAAGSNDTGCDTFGRGDETDLSMTVDGWSCEAGCSFDVIR